MRDMRQLMDDDIVDQRYGAMQKRQIQPALAARTHAAPALFCRAKGKAHGEKPGLLRPVFHTSAKHLRRA